MLHSIYLPLPRTASSGGAYRWHSSPVTYNTRQYLLKQQSSLSAVTANGFQSSNVVFDAEKIVKALANSTHFALLVGENGRVYGFAFYFVVPAKRYAYLNKMCIVKDAQCNGLGYDFLKKLIQEHHIKWLGGRTQNLGVINLYSRLATYLYPFSADYKTAFGQRIQDYALSTVPQLYKTAVEIERDSGIYRGLYGSKLGNVTKKKTSPFIQQIQQKLASYGFDNKAGDSVLLTAEL